MTGEKARKNMGNALILAAAVVIPVMFIYIMSSSSFLGFVTGPKVTLDYEKALNLEFTESTDYVLDLGETPDAFNLRSLSISGKVTGKGRVAVYIDAGDGRILVLNSSYISNEGISTISSSTALSAGKVIRISKIGAAVELNTEPGIVIAVEENNTGNLPEETIEDMPANDTDAQEESATNNETEAGANETAANVTEESAGNNETEAGANETGTDDGGNNTTIIPEQPAGEENATTDGEGSGESDETGEQDVEEAEIIVEETSGDEEEGIETSIETAFNDLCVDSCLLSDGISDSRIRLIIEIDGAALYISRISYSIEETLPEEFNVEMDVKDSKGSKVSANIKIKDMDGNVVKEIGAGKPKGGMGIFAAKKEKLTAGTYDVDIVPENHPIMKIAVKGMRIGDDVTDFIDIDKITQPDDRFEQVYAIDPTAVEFESANVTVIAKGKTLYKCRGWNFTGQECAITAVNCIPDPDETDSQICDYSGGWEYLMDIIPGQEYSFTLSPDDPGFAEGSPSNGTADADDLIWIVSNYDGGTWDSGSYADTAADDSSYWCTGYDNALSETENHWYAVLDFNVSSLGITSLDGLTVLFSAYAGGWNSACSPGSSDNPECADVGVCENDYLRIYDWDSSQWDIFNSSYWNMDSDWDTVQQNIERSNSNPETGWLNSTGWIRIAIEHRETGMNNNYETKLALDFVQLTVEYTPNNPPATVTGLDEIATGPAWIVWNWTNPSDSEFNHTEIWINGTFYANVSAPENYYIAAGLSPGTLYEIQTRTVDHAGNINTTWVNDTSQTTSYSNTLMMEWGTTTANDSWTTVNLQNSYTSPVIAASGHYTNNSIPFVTRITDAAGTIFRLRIQNPGGTSLSSDTVHYIVMEEGNWTLPDGRAIESQSYASTVVDDKNNWTGESQAYKNSYTTPVVIGSVMSYNDPDWQAFVSWGSSRTDPPNSANLVISRHVAEDPDTTRADEIVGFIVIEQGNSSGTGLGSAYEAVLGTDTVQGVDNSPPYTYNLNHPFTSTPEVGIVSLMGLDGGDGGWAQLHGPSPISTTQLKLSVDEDKEGDAERGHTTEQVGYMVFETAGYYFGDTTPPNVSDLRPAAGSLYNISDMIEISANVTDDVNVSTVSANITFPNSTVQQITLSKVGSTDKYNTTFTIPNLQGQYNISFIANDTYGNLNNAESTYFTGTGINQLSSNSPDDQEADIGQETTIIWKIFQGNSAPGHYYVERNGELFEGPYQWANNTDIIIRPNNFFLGTWNYTIYYNDSAGDTGIPDSVFITVSDNTTPSCDDLTGGGSFPTLVNITIDGDMDEWDAILSNPMNYISDLTVEGGDADPVQTADRDLTEFAFTWDDESLYFYYRRLYGGSNQVSMLVYLDYGLDGYMNSTDKMVKFVWSGTNEDYDADLYNYIPAGTADEMLGSGFNMPGSITINKSLDADVNGGAPSGIEIETMVNWTDLGFSGPAAFNFQASSARGSGTNLPSQLEDNMGVVSSKYARLLFRPDNAKSASNGTSVYYYHDLMACGMLEDTIDLVNSSDQGFSITLYYPDGTEITDTNGNNKADVTLGADNFTTIIVKIDIPGTTPTGTVDTTIITAYSSVDNTTSRSVTDITSIGSITITPKSRVISGAQGILASLNYTVSNYQPFDDTIEIEAASGQGWSIALYYLNGTPITDTDGDSHADIGSLLPSQSKDILLKISIPSNATIGQNDITTIRINSSADPALTTTAAANTTVRERITIEPDYNRSVGVGDSTFYLLTITNSFNESDVIDITYTYTSNWSAVFLESDKVTSLTDTDSDSIVDIGSLGAYGSRHNIYARLAVPAGANEGDNEFTAVYANSSIDSAVFDTSIINTTARIIIIYSDAARTIEQDDFNYSDTVYARAHALSGINNVYYEWIDSNSTVIRISPDIPVSAEDDADDLLFLNSSFLPGNWTAVVFNAQDDIEISRAIFYLVYNIPPDVFDLKPAAGSQYNPSEIIEVSANVTSNIDVDAVLANITFPNGTMMMLALSEAGATDRYNGSFTIPDLPGQYNLTFIANDTAGNVNRTESTYFTVSDASPPGITFVDPTPANNSLQPPTNVTINATVTDNIGVGSCILNFNGVNESMEETGSGKSKTCTATKSIAADGWYNFTVFANDTSGNMNQSETRYITNIDDIIPDINSAADAPDPVIIGKEIIITADVTDNVQVSSVWVKINGTNSTMTQQSQDIWNLSYDTLDLDVGPHNYTVYANDTKNNNAIPVTGTFNVTVPELVDPLRAGLSFLLFVPPIHDPGLANPQDPYLRVTAFNDNTSLFIEDMDADGDSDDSVGNATNMIILDKGESRLVFISEGADADSDDGDYFYIESLKSVTVVVGAKSPWNAFTAAAEGADYGGEEYYIYARYDEEYNSSMDMIIFAYENQSHIRVYDITGNITNKDGIDANYTTIIVDDDGVLINDIILDKGGHIDYIGGSFLPGGHTARVVANKRIGVIAGSFTEDNNGRDGGFYASSVDGKTAGTEFYTYAGKGLNGDEDELYFFGRETSNVTVEAFYDNGTLDQVFTFQLNSSNEYIYPLTNTGAEPFRHITATALLSILAGTWIEPGTGDIADFAPSSVGGGVGKNFNIFVPGPATRGYTNAIIFAYYNNTFVEVINTTNSYYFGNMTLDSREHWNFNVTYETILTINSTKNVGVEVTNYDDNIAFTAVAAPFQRLIVVKTSRDKDEVALGDYITFDINISNPFEGNIYNIQITDVLQNSMIYVNSTEPGGVTSPVIQNDTPTGNDTTVTWNMSLLKAGQTKTITLVAQINSSDLTQKNFAEGMGVDENNQTIGASDVSILFMIDSQSPLIANVSDVPDPQVVNDTVTITAVVTDDWWVSEVIASVNGTNYTMNNTGGDLYSYDYYGDTIGTFNYTIYAQDSSGNSNVSDVFTLTIASIENASANVSDDSYMLSGKQDTNYGNLTIIMAGRKNGGNIYRGIIRFNLSHIPSGVRIDYAFLSLYFENIPSGDNTGSRTHGAHRVQQSPPREWKGLEVTWNNYSTGNSWTSAGGDFNATPADTVTFSSAQLNTRIKFDVRDDVQSFVDNMSANSGWVIKDQSETSNKWRVDYSSWENANPMRVPLLVIDFTDIKPPSVSGLVPPANTSLTINSIAEIAANVTDNIDVGTVLVNITFPNGTVEQLALSKAGSTDKYNASFAVPALPGRYNITFIANDTAGNVNYTESTYFIGKDSTPPAVFDLKPAADSQYNLSDMIEISSNATDYFGVDDVLANITYPDSTSMLLALSKVGVTDRYNMSFTIPNLPGRYNITFIANDTYGNVNSTESTYFIANDVIAPSVSLISPANGTGSTSPAQNFTFTAEDNVYTILNCTLFINGIHAGTDGYVINGTITVIANGTVPEQVNSWYVLCYDSGGNSNQSAEWQITVDYTPPNITIIRPAQGEIVGFNVTLDADVTDNAIGVDSAWYSIYNLTWSLNGTLNKSLGFTDIVDTTSLAEINYTFRVYANDTLGNVIYEETNFTVDNTNPFIQILAPLNNTYWNIGFNLNILLQNTRLNNSYFNITDSSGSSVFDNASSMISESSFTFADFVNISAMADGNYSLFVYADDFVGLNSTKQQSFVADSTNPNVVIITPVPGSGFNQTDTLIIEANVSDAISLDTVLVNVSWGSWSLILVMTDDDNDNIFNATFTNTTWINYGGAGIYDISITANDTAGNYNSSEVTYVTVNDVTSPHVTDITPLAGTSFEQDNPIMITANVTDPYYDDVDYVIVNITWDSTYAVLEMSDNDNNSIFNATFNDTVYVDTYGIAIIAKDSAGNNNDTETTYFNVNDTTVPDVIIPFPVPGAEFSIVDTVLISANVTDNANMSLVYAEIIYPNGSFSQVALADGDGDSVYEANFTDLAQKGIFNITIIANDTWNNVNDTEKTFFVRRPPTGTILDVLEVLSGDSTYVNYTETVLNNVSGILDILVDPMDYTINQIIIYGYDESTPYSVIRVNNETPDSIHLDMQTYMIDLSGINVTSANITVTARGNFLFKCTNFTPSQECIDEYEQIRTDLVVGQNYTIILNKTDPLFGETLQGPENTSDSYIRGGAPNANYGGAARIRVGKSASAANPIRGIIWFNLSSIPYNAFITSANLSLYFYNIPGIDTTANRTHGIHRVDDSRDWQELEVTWNEYRTGSSWTSPGGDFNATPTDTRSFNSSSLNSFIRYDVASDVQAFANNDSGNFGWIIKDQNESTVRIRRDYRSSNYAANISRRPILAVSFIDMMPPWVTNIEPAQGSVFNQTDMITIAADVADSFGIDTVFANVTWDSAYQILIMTDPDSDGRFNATFTNTTGLYNYTVRFFANDTSGNINDSESTYFIVNDATSPYVSIITPSDGQDFNLSDPVEITANVTDSVGVDTVMVNVTWDNRYETIEMSDPDGDNVFNATFTNTTQAGFYTARIIANDTSGNVNDSETAGFNVAFYQVSGEVTDSVFSLVPSTVTVYNVSGDIIHVDNEQYEFNISGLQVYNISIKPASGNLAELKFVGLSVSTDIFNFTRLEDTAENITTPGTFDNWTQVVSWQPHAGISYNRALVNMTYSADTLSGLYKCADWDFNSQECSGIWGYEQDVDSNGLAGVVFSFGFGDPGIGIGPRTGIYTYYDLEVEVSPDVAEPDEAVLVKAEVFSGTKRSLQSEVSSITLDIIRVKNGSSTAIVSNQSMSYITDGIWTYETTPPFNLTGTHVATVTVVTNDTVIQTWKDSATFFVGGRGVFRIKGISPDVISLNEIARIGAEVTINGEPVPAGELANASLKTERINGTTQFFNDSQLGKSDGMVFLDGIFNESGVYYLNWSVLYKNDRKSAQEIMAVVPWSSQLSNISSEISGTVMNAIISTRDSLLGLITDMEQHQRFTEEEIFLITDSVNSMTEVAAYLETGQLTEEEAKDEYEKIKKRLGKSMGADVLGFALAPTTGLPAVKAEKRWSSISNTISIILLIILLLIISIYRERIFRREEKGRRQRKGRGHAFSLWYIPENLKRIMNVVMQGERKSRKVKKAAFSLSYVRENISRIMGAGRREKQEKLTEIKEFRDTDEENKREEILDEIEEITGPVTGYQGNNREEMREEDMDHPAHELDLVDENGNKVRFRKYVE